MHTIAHPHRLAVNTCSDLGLRPTRHVEDQCFLVGVRIVERVQLEPAFLLHGYDYRESSRLLEFFTSEHGRLTVVAKGARRAKSKFKAVLQPFNLLQISWSGGELPTLTAAELQNNQVRLEGNALYSGFYMNELLLRLTAKRDPHPEIFSIFKQTLRGLSGEECNIVLRLFEKGLLEALGYAE